VCVLVKERVKKEGQRERKNAGYLIFALGETASSFSGAVTHVAGKNKNVGRGPSFALARKGP